MRMRMCGSENCETELVTKLPNTHTATEIVVRYEVDTVVNHRVVPEAVLEIK